MDILACCKLVPDLDMMNGSDWSIDSHFQVDASFVRTMINPYDESALELILKLRDQAIKNKVNLNLTALTVGAVRSPKMLKNLFALQYDSVIRVACDSGIRFNASIVSKIIGYYVKNIKNHQVIVLGSQSNEGDNGKTPLLVAERLGIPCITSVTGIKLAEQKDCLTVTARIDDMMVEQTIKPPVVLAVGNVAGSYIRVPTLKQKMQCVKKEVTIYTLESLGIRQGEIEVENDNELIELSYEKNEKKCVFIQGANSSQKADELYRAYLRQRIKI